jgi:hypothetical protein
MLPTNTCKPERLDVKNAIPCVSHQIQKSLPILVHVTSQSLHIIVHVLHNLIKYDF